MIYVVLKTTYTLILQYTKIVYNNIYDSIVYYDYTGADPGFQVGGEEAHLK